VSHRNHRFNAFRHWSSLIVLLACFGTLAAQAVKLQWEQGEFLKKEGAARSVRNIDVNPNRGRILDRNGEILAVSTPVDSISVDPKVFCASRDGWPKLVDVLEMELSRIEEICVRHANSGFAYLKRHLPPEKAAAVLALEIRGVDSRREYRRYYPLGPVAAHIVGVTDLDDTGLEGLERRFDSLLAGSPGVDRIVKDSRGRVVDRVQRVTAVRHGTDLTTSIDARIQYATRRALAASVSEFKGAGASAVVLDSRSGEVLAMVNVPDYNPNRRHRTSGPELRNRAVTDLIEPGSTIKPFTVAMALESGRFKVDTMIDTHPGRYRIGGHTISDVNNYGALSVSRVIIKSSNIGTAKIAMEFPALQLYHILRDVGFGSATGIELPGERQGSMPRRKTWRPIEHATLSYGYGLAATPIQIAQAYAVLANKGRMVPLTVRRRVEPVEGERVLSPVVVRSVVGMLEEVISNEGTARRARVPLYRTGGKTGTSHKLIDGRYAEDRYVSSFAGFAPASDPRFVMVIVVDDPRSERYYGGYVAAPVFAEVMEEVLRLYNVAPDDLQPDAVQMAARVTGAGT
jgi:cell division protein FtsI (penicillin-binding protein 3)